MKYNYFAYDVNYGTEYFETEAEALAYAEEALYSYRQEAKEEGWNDDVERIVVGKITHRIEKFNVVTRKGELDEDGCDENGVYWPNSECDEMNDYRLARGDTGSNGVWNQTFEQGLSKREYIAALALQGMLACSLNGDFPMSEHARFAVKAADALIDALGKKQ